MKSLLIQGGRLIDPSQGIDETGSLLISDGKIYMGHTEHSSIDPKPRGAPFVCLDAETGEEIWKAPGLFRSTRWGGRGLIGDGIMATMDTYDQRIYAVGKGPSK